MLTGFQFSFNYIILYYILWGGAGYATHTTVALLSSEAVSYTYRNIPNALACV
jgi:hypothetical protein